MTHALAFGFAIGFLVVLFLVTVISLRPITWSRARVKAPPSFYMPRPRAINLQAHFGTLRRLPSSPTRSTFSASSDDSEESYEKTAVKEEISASYTPPFQVQPTSTLSMLAAAPGHILALVSSPVPLRSRPSCRLATAPIPIQLSFPHETVKARSSNAPPIVHRRRGAVSLGRPAPTQSGRQRPESLQTLESPSVYSQVTSAVPDDIPIIMVSAPSCPTLGYPEEGREGGMLGPRGYYF